VERLTVLVNKVDILARSCNQMANPATRVRFSLPERSLGASSHPLFYVPAGPRGCHQRSVEGTNWKPGGGMFAEV